jgi:hypothetical protein
VDARITNIRKGLLSDVGKGSLADSLLGNRRSEASGVHVHYDSYKVVKHLMPTVTAVTFSIDEQCRVRNTVSGRFYKI